MTAATPSPMQTPDIGGLLRRAQPPARPVPPSLPVQDVDPPTAAIDAAPAGTEASSPATATSAVKPARRRRSKEASSEAASVTAQTQVAASGSSHQYLRSIAVYLPRSVHQRIKAEAAARATTATALILAAVNATHGRVGELLDEDRGGSAGGGDLFEIPQARKVAEPTVQTTIRVTDAQLQAIAELAATHDANRSQLITAALRLHLAPTS